MGHVTYNLYFHVVFSTKKRLRILTKQSLRAINATVRELANEIGFKLIAQGGYEDHLHLLLSLPPQRNLAMVVKRIKGRTSREHANLYWQTGYYAETVSRNGVADLTDYILNQWEKHSLRSLEDAGFFEPTFLPPN
jgi:putative transposase